MPNDPNTESRKQEVTARLFSAGFTLFGIGFPVLGATISLLRDPNIGARLGDELEIAIWILLPGLGLCAVLLLVCLATMVRLVDGHAVAAVMTATIILYLIAAVTVWALSATVF